jgi:hypothetical protein
MKSWAGPSTIIGSAGDLEGLAYEMIGVPNDLEGTTLEIKGLPIELRGGSQQWRVCSPTKNKEPCTVRHRVLCESSSNSCHP